MAFFGVNPFLSPVGSKIEQATDASLPSESWELNMEVCDIINETEEGPKDAIKAIRKRLTMRNFTVVMYTLTVLETCIKNCGRRFHLLVCNKDFLQELIKIIGPKNDPPVAVQEKVLSLIQSWADAFRNVPELGAVVNFYQDLKQKVDFPMTDLDSMAPIHTPQRVHVDEVANPAISSSLDVPSDSPGKLTTAQVAKLTSDLQVVEGNMTVLGEMLSELVPGKEPPGDLQLLQELHTTCEAMQKRLMELINQLSNDEVTAELLRINDGLNNLFLRYSRYEKKRCGIKETAGESTQLIDLTSAGAAGLPSLLEGVSLSSQLSSIPSVTASNHKDDEFDMFAQSRKATYESSKTAGSSYEANRETVPSGSLASRAQSNLENTSVLPIPDLVGVHSERDFDEMAEWLGENSKPKDSLSASEFERFLSERAAAAETVNPVSPTTSSNSTRSKKTEDEAMFAL